MPTISSRPPQMPRILAYAYVCHPDGGSEPGVGWMWSRILAGIAETWVLTRPIPDLPVDWERVLATAPEGAQLRIIEVDVPGWLKRVSSVDVQAPRLQRLQYLVWLAAAYLQARRLVRRHRFDLVWHLTFANVWMGTTAALLGRPFVLGPVGGGVAPPWRLVPQLGARGVVREIARHVVRNASRTANPLAAVTLRRARLVLTQNEDTLRWLPARVRARARVLPNIVLDDGLPKRGRRGGSPTALYIGRLDTFKGASLAIRAMAHLPEWTLLVVGGGPEEDRHRQLARRIGVEERVRFLGWRSRDEVLGILRSEADVMIFPSLHEEGGMAVAEAVEAGVPVVALDRGGPPTLGAHAIRAGSVESTVADLAKATRALYGTVPTAPRRLDVVSVRAEVRGVLAEAGMLPLVSGGNAPAGVAIPTGVSSSR